MEYIINVVHKRKHKYNPHDFYCGRPSVLGNKYSHIPTGTKAQFIVATREEAIAKHKEDFYKSIETDKFVREELMKIAEHLKQHGQINLVCWCAPKSCHCDTIKEYLLQLLK